MAAINKSPLLFFSRATMIVVLTMLFNSASASPTSNEFEECHDRAAKILLGCLNKNTNSIYIDQCWGGSKSSYHACHSDVMSRHDRSAMKKRRALAEALEAEIEAMKLND